MIRGTKQEQKMPKIVAVLPCRIKSSRLVAKSLQPVGNYSILELLISQIKKSKLVDEIILAISKKTGNDLFKEVAKKNKIKFFFGQEADVLGRIIKAAKTINGDIVLRITSENPFIYWEGIDPLIKSHIKGGYDFSYYMGLPLGSGLELINLRTLSLSHRYGNKRHRGELSTLYIYENRKKFKINKVFPEQSLRRPEIRLTVDTPQDLWVTRIIHEKLGKKKKLIRIKKIIKFLDSHPSIKKINSNAAIHYKRYM